jgi:hypothetical protein
MCIGRGTPTLVNSYLSTPSSKRQSNRHSSSVDRDPESANPSIAAQSQAFLLSWLSPSPKLASRSLSVMVNCLELSGIMAAVGICPDGPQNCASDACTPTLSRHVRNSTHTTYTKSNLRQATRNELRTSLKQFPLSSFRYDGPSFWFESTVGIKIAVATQSPFGAVKPSCHECGKLCEICNLVALPALT